MLTPSKIGLGPSRAREVGQNRQCSRLEAPSRLKESEICLELTWALTSMVPLLQPPARGSLITTCTHLAFTVPLILLSPLSGQHDRPDFDDILLKCYLRTEAGQERCSAFSKEQVRNTVSVTVVPTSCCPSITLTEVWPSTLVVDLRASTLRRE